jgi:hypothetical protein
MEHKIQVEPYLRGLQDGGTSQLFIDFNPLPGRTVSQWCSFFMIRTAIK